MKKHAHVVLHYKVNVLTDTIISNDNLTKTTFANMLKNLPDTND